MARSRRHHRAAPGRPRAQVRPQAPSVAPVAEHFLRALDPVLRGRAAKKEAEARHLNSPDPVTMAASGLLKDNALQLGAGLWPLRDLLVEAADAALGEATLRRRRAASWHPGLRREGWHHGPAARTLCRGHCYEAAFPPWAWGAQPVHSVLSEGGRAALEEAPAPEPEPCWTVTVVMASGRSAELKLEGDQRQAISVMMLAGKALDCPVLSLVSADGRLLDPWVSLDSAGVQDGATLTVVAGQPDETGLDPRDVEVVIAQCQCSRALAVLCTRRHSGDIVEAIMEISSLLDF